MSNRFEVDRKGLAKLLSAKSKAWIAHELIQNAWDEDGVTEVRVSLDAIPGRPEAIFVVEDDAPEGFRDLSHAYTLFAESYKKADPNKRGRFNLGEKFVLALALKAEIATTTGTIVFEGETRRQQRRKTEKGSVFTATFRLTHAETAEIKAGIALLIPPAGIATTFNGQLLKTRMPIAEFEWTLPTEISDADGHLQSTKRKTSVRLYEPLPGETASLYERGIPVVEVDDRWHVDVQQKVPLNMQRDNVRPAYLRQIRTFTLNAMHEQLDDFTTSWVTEAVTDKRVEIAAVSSYLDAKYGDQRVIADPLHPESMSRAQAAGWTVIHGRSEAAATWEKIREGSLALPAGQVFPIKAESAAAYLSEDQWTDGIKNIVAYAKVLANELLGCQIEVTIANDPKMGLNAAYGHRSLMLNVGRLGWDWFEHGPCEAVDRLLLHEFGHHFASNHLDDSYYQALCHLGARMVKLALCQPDFFTRFQV